MRIDLTPIQTQLTERVGYYPAIKLSDGYGRARRRPLPHSKSCDHPDYYPASSSSERLFLLLPGNAKDKLVFNHQQVPVGLV